MQRLEVSGAVRPIYGSLGVKRLTWGAGRQLTYIRAPQFIRCHIVSAFGLVKGEYKRINSMQDSPSWKANSQSATQDISYPSRNPKFHCFFKRSRRWTHTTSWGKILWSYTLILTSILDYSPIWSFFSYCQTKILSKILIPFQTCYMTHSPHLSYFTNIIMCEKGYELGRLSLHIFLWLPVTWISYLAYYVTTCLASVKSVAVWNLTLLNSD